MLERFGRLLFSFAIIGIGVETLLVVSSHSPDSHKIVPVIPWLPAIPILVYPVGAIFLLCGSSLLLQRHVLLSSTMLGVVMVICGLTFDGPRHLNLMSAEWRTNVLEPIVIGSLAWLAPVGLPEWLRRTSRSLISFALIVFGIAHFQVLTFIASMVPTWIPCHRFWTIFSGIAFMAAGLSFATGYRQRWAALGLGLMFGVWLLTIHLPFLLDAPCNPDKWSDVLIVAALWGGFWATAGNLRKVRSNETRSLGAQA